MRVANEKQLETRILELLDNKSGKIQNVIEVERTLARMRGELERMEDRKRYLTNRTSYSTVTISARQDRDYVPPKAPSFLARVSSARADSIDRLLDFCRTVAVAVVFLTRWVVPILVLVLLIAWVVRWVRRRRRRDG